MRTKDFSVWQRLVIQPRLFRVAAFGRHRNHLFCVACGSDPDLNQLYLYWLNVERDACVSMVTRNGKCPHSYFCDSAASVGDSIVLFGGFDGTNFFPVVVEYSVRKACWLRSSWPELPRPLAGTIPVLDQHYLHLFSGTESRRYHSQDYQSCVLSVRLSSSHQPSSAWSSDVIPPPPRRASGAVLLHGHIVVVGGCEASESTFSSSCYALDVTSQKWLRLPSLTVARSEMALVVSNGFLVAVGGLSGDSHSKGSLLRRTDIELMRVEQPSG